VVFLEVDQHRSPAAFLIGYELDAGHASILPAEISRADGSRGGDRKSKSPPCRRKRDKDGAHLGVETSERVSPPPVYSKAGLRKLRSGLGRP
jgi:hypothetical protein